MKILSKLLIVILISYFAFSCVESKNERRIKVGVILPLTGPASEIGNTILNGIKVANTESNKTDKNKIDLLIEDSQLDAKQAIAAANKLIFVDKVKVIIGVASSTDALAVAPICEKNKVIMLSSTASTPLLTKAGDYIFRIYPSDIYDGKTLSDFAYNSRGLKSFSIFYLNNDFGNGLKDVFIKDYTKLGGKIKDAESFLPDATDFRTQLTKIKQSNSEGILVIAIDMQYINIIKQIRQLNITSEIFAPVTFDNPLILKQLGNAANGIFYSRPMYSHDTTSLQERKFRTDYKKVAGNEPPILAALGFDTYKLISNSLLAQSYNSDLIKAYLYKVHYSGVSGNIKFDKNGDIMPDMEIMLIKNDKAIEYEKIKSTGK